MEGKKVVLEFVVCWEGGAALFRSTFRICNAEFYLNKHVSSVIVEQHGQFPGCFLSVLHFEINSILTQVKVSSSEIFKYLPFNQESRCRCFHMKPGYFSAKGSLK